MTFIGTRERGDDTDLHSSVLTKQTIHNYTKPSKHRSQAFVGTEQKSNKKFACNYCGNEAHAIYNCETFLKLTPRDRGNAAKNKKLCMNCLRTNHTSINCRSVACKRCNRKHNSLLHFDNASIQNPATSTIQGVQQDQQSTNNINLNEQPKRNFAITYDAEVLLGTARVKILDRNNHEHECRVLLDGCSQCNFITEELATKLKLNKENVELPFAGLGELTTKSKFKVKTKIRSRINNFESKIEFVALPTITGILPARQVDKRSLNIPTNIKLADPDFNKPAKIDALIGATLFYKLLSNGQIQLDKKSNITCQKTLLGWIIAGEIDCVQNHYPKIRSCHLIKLETQLTRFWEIEAVPHKEHLSSEEEQCEKFYAKTTKRDSDGRYITRLLFNDKKNKIGNSYDMALKRFYSLERKLSKNEALKQQYSDFLREYHDLGHMTEITQTDNRQEGYYIPHHAVIKDDNITTKLRVVFDASAKSTTNISLNDALLVGPTIQDELIFIIMRFRLHNVVITADLQKMYRQIKIDERDAVYQKILWREDNNHEIRVFQLVTATQGTATAPFIAARTLHQLAIDEGHQFPLAATSLKNDFYVDDLLSGAKTIQAALKLKSQLIDILKLGGFELHKWASNKPELLEISERQSIQGICLDNQCKKLLGIHWDAKTDSINYVIKSVPNEKRVTKRIILSEIAQLFDPLGLLGPVIIKAKLIMQDLWKAQVGWDESIPQQIHTSWINFKTELPIINQFTIRRHTILANAIEIQLHGFCDASERAYGACVYLRSIDEAHNCMVQLVCAKSRVAPVKTTSIPRLELCAAFLLANLCKRVFEALKVSITSIKYWSDSTIALNWIKTSPHLLKTFVANRVAEIQSITNINNWYHIATEENPADYISRGQPPSEFIKNSLWLQGPTWLTHSEKDWKIMQLSNIEVPEQKLKTALTILNSTNNKNDTIERFSSINSLIRFVALCRRIINNRRVDSKVIGKYSIEELKGAQQQIIKIIQNQHFSREIKALQEGVAINSKSTLLCLSPILDNEGILRVGGRLTNSSISLSKKYPILLPRDNHVTRLIIRDEHEKNWHAGVQATLNLLRNRYWPIDGKNVTRFIINKCVRCCKLNPKIPKYIMGELPKTRVTQSRPFDNVGLDYCGPFHLKERKFRNKQRIKSYVAVFVCFTTKAVHLELVTDLTTETCLEAVKRFIARRGSPSNMYSDNATNFVGAKNEILKIRQFLLSDEINNKFFRYLQNEGIEWHFTPPRSPHFGGLWEAAVKSFKKHLFRTVGEALFTYEQFNTCIIEIESILNSRPITPLSSDPNDLMALAPIHFLIGDISKGMPEHDYQNVPINRLSMWQRVQSVKQHFWKRWHKEYLNELRTRSKWHTGNANNIKIGTLVTVKEENLPPMHWSLGRIIAVHPGADNIVRVATIKTQHGVYKRCVKKLAPLPIDI